MVVDVALSGCHNLDTLWPPQSGQFTILMFPLWRSNIASSWSVLCIRDITLYWRCQTGPIFVLLCHCRLVNIIEENNKMVIVGLRLVSSQTRLLPTMTLYSTIIRVYCRVQLNFFKKNQSRCLPKSTPRFMERGVDTCRLIDFPVVASGQLPQPFREWLGEANDQMFF